MKCIILAAGYATRLYPLTENFPKPLLKVGEKTILDHLIDDVDTSGVIDEYIVVSNHKFYNIFCDWAKEKSGKIRVLDDMTESNETRLGAVKDIQFALDTIDASSDVLVLAGDNVLDFSLVKFIEYAKEKNASCIMRYFEEDEKRLLKSGVVTLDANDRVVKMTEKSPTPETHWCTPPFYYYTKEDAGLVKTAIENGCNTDAPGSFISWLCEKSPVFAMLMPGKRFDIGNLESYEKVKAEYKGIL